MTSGGGWRFAGLTGDFNGIHWSNVYARALSHPQRILGQCLARLPEETGEAGQRLDVWLRGPVFYGSEVSLRAVDSAGETLFALYTDADVRPAMVARRSAATAAFTMSDE